MMPVNSRRKYFQSARGSASHRRSRSRELKVLLNSENTTCFICDQPFTAHTDIYWTGPIDLTPVHTQCLINQLNEDLSNTTGAFDDKCRALGLAVADRSNQKPLTIKDIL